MDVVLTNVLSVTINEIQAGGVIRGTFSLLQTETLYIGGKVAAPTAKPTAVPAETEEPRVSLSAE